MRGYVFGSSGSNSLFGASVPNNSPNNGSSNIGTDPITNSIAQQYGNYHTYRSSPSSSSYYSGPHNSITDIGPDSVAIAFAIWISHCNLCPYWLSTTVHEPQYFAHANH